ncbi:MAG: flavodoxin [Planctomycetota bacterium]
MRIGIVWGSTSGNTTDAAEMLAEFLSIDASDVRDVASTSVAEMLEYDFLIVGCSTWDIGELQHDWSDRFEDLEGDFSGKLIAFLGCGDAAGYPDNFQDGIGILWEKWEPLGPTLIGKWPTEDYEFDHSRALLDDGKNFVGLALDYDNESELSEERIEAWAKQLQAELASRSLA